jgi:putative selenium metabolism protein SsnA
MLITNARLITWSEPNQILDDHALYISDGKIVELGLTSKLIKRYPDEELLDARGQFVMPGLINAHGHYYSAFLRGISVPGWPWPNDLHSALRRLFWPFDKAMREEDVRYSALVYLVDAIKHGMTTQFDHHSSPNFIDGCLDVIAGAVDQSGTRAVLCFETTDRDGKERAQAGITENVRFIRRCQNEDVAGGRVKANFGIHACMTVTEDTLAACREATPEGTGFHVHVGESSWDQYLSLHLTGTRSVDRLHKHGMLGERTIAAHAVHLDAREVHLLSQTGTWVSHQPRSNMHEAGIAEVESFNRAGARTCIGNDGMSQTMWKEWQTAYLAQKVKMLDPWRMPSYMVIEMAVYNAARLASLYYGMPIGMIKPGAAADLIFVDYHPWTPLTIDNLPDHMMEFQETMITTTIVDGKVLMLDRQLLTLDEEAITARAREIAPSLWKRYEELVPPLSEYEPWDSNWTY